MISSLNPRDQQFLNHLNHIADRMEAAQRRIATGLRVSSVSDDPDSVSTLLAARAHLASATQIQSNLARIKAEVDTGEQALQSAIQLLERARTLGAQGATSTLTTEQRRVLAQEAGSVLEQMVGLTSVQVEGRFVFSGDADSLIPYTIDLSQAAPVSGYLGSAASRQVQHPNGSTFAASRTAQEIFDAANPADNVFASLAALHQALLTGDEQDVFDATQALRRPAEHLNSQLAFYGTTQNKVAEAGVFVQNLIVQLQGRIATNEDADLSEAILDLNQTQTQQEAALSSRAQLPRRTLFDYLG